MKLSDFDYALDPSLIAQEPAKEREESRLLVLDKNLGQWEHKKNFGEILNYFRSGDVLVLNNTKVLHARLLGNRETGGKVDSLLISSFEDKAIAMIQTARCPKVGEKYTFGSYTAKVEKREKDGWLLSFQGVPAFKIMEELGLPPLPPYIKRKGEQRKEKESQDRQRYQTVYAQHPGSIAAPTAGLHFTESLLSQIKQKGVEILYVTLHVGTGTFLPVKCDEIEQHQMHTESYQMAEETAIKINLALKEKRRILATGTTSCRTLETSGKSGQIVPGSGNTNLFIYPGYEYKIVSGLITNFHLPKSTLLLLVSAFAGKDLIFRAYQDAIQKQYRFFSYGDAMFIY
ncbi:MAG: tRNA preQ1(34) S-adenosylmethionine ribosyltransferase-isomerase QueA [Candidatus Brocadiae bacterium]|nr:tRNA preQ1(34) S-adenosylmethionine ribosyltransferase-isomerase QueA [Candidatus Brocadiia bacterium]